MQKRIGILITVLLSLICLVFLVCCDEKPDEPSVCSTHTDSDSNGKCDLCDTVITTQNPQDKPCEVCADTDGDRKCDVCSNSVAPELPAPCEHEDAEYDGKCDLCKESMADALTLINLRKTDFTIVAANGLDGDSVLRIKKLSADLDKLGVKMPFYTEKDAPENEYEIIFGETTSRGEEYLIDSHELGLKGYAIKIIGKKIVVVAGSSESLATAIDVLKSEFFGIGEKTVVLINRVAYPSQNISVVQNDYKVNTITLNGNDIVGYKIATDKKNADSKVAAGKLQKLLYENTGYWLTVVDSSEVSSNAIYIDIVEKCGEDGFSFTVGEGYMRFESEYITSISREPCKFFEMAIEQCEGATLALDSGSAFTKNVHFVYYKDFGAVGDGITNDFAAIAKAHEYANKGGHKKIVAESGKTYYLDKTAYNIYIKCDVDWTGAKFIIDDSTILSSDTVKNYDVFYINSSYSVSSFSASKSAVIQAINAAGGIDRKNITKIDLGLGYPAILKVYNSSHKNYIRTGSNATSGESQLEVILVDEYGNIDPSTPFMFDYEKITSIYAYRIDEEPLSIVGGEFTTIANSTTSLSFSYKRGINITRSNVTVSGVKHYVVGEGEKGSPYGYFIGIENANNILLDECVFTARKTYYDGNTGVGSYEFSSRYSVGVTWKKCTQANLFDADGKPLSNDVWGVMDSNYCKNLKFSECSLNRFDTHHGVLNTEITNSKLKNIRIVGAGTLLIENVELYGNTLISLREDYGAFWHGDVIIKDVTMMPTSSDVQMFEVRWYNHDFGYQTALPENIVIDGLNVQGDNKTVNLFLESFANSSHKILQDEFEKPNSQTGEVTVTPNKNKMLPPEKIEIKNSPDIEIILPGEDVEFFKDTVMTVE